MTLFGNRIYLLTKKKNNKEVTKSQMMTSTHTLSSVSVIINHFLQTWAKADVRRCIKIQQGFGHV